MISRRRFLGALSAVAACAVTGVATAASSVGVPLAVTRKLLPPPRPGGTIHRGTLTLYFRYRSDRLHASIGTTNEDAFLGFPAGTLLLDHVRWDSELGGYAVAKYTGHGWSSLWFTRDKCWMNVRGPNGGSFFPKTNFSVLEPIDATRFEHWEEPFNPGV